MHIYRKLYVSNKEIIQFEHYCCQNSSWYSLAIVIILKGLGPESHEMNCCHYCGKIFAVSGIIYCIVCNVSFPKQPYAILPGFCDGIRRSQATLSIFMMDLPDLRTVIQQISLLLIINNSVTSILPYSGIPK